jgi:ABC-type oligopeptide transport system ATPase subunit
LKIVQQVTMVAAVVIHDTSRALDPQIHAHVCIMNVTHDPIENRWKAVEPRGFYKYQSYLREVSYNKLAEKMKEGGYQIEKARSGGFNIKGFSADLRVDFSKRREEIERVADILKTRDQNFMHSIAAKTRAEKAHVKPEELKTHWLSEASPYIANIRQIISQSIPLRESSGIPASRSLSLGEEHVFERHSVVDERILLREALIAGRGDVKLDQLRGALPSRLQSGELIQTRRMIASREMLATEKSVVTWAVQGKGSFPRMGKFTAQDSLSPEQNRAAEKLLASQDRVVVLIGDAGAGKSTTLPVIIRGVQETGNLTFACAPSSGAAQELQDKLKVQTDTVQQLLVNEKLQEQVAGRVIIVDEAGLLSIRQMQALCQLADRQKCRLLLVGDVKQHHSVEAGDALRALQKYAGVETVRLKEIHRQENEAYRKVVRLLASGKAHAAFGQLDRLGGVHEQKDWSKLLDQAAATYVDKVQAGQSCLAISPVWSEVNAFTGVLRDRLKQAGVLSKEERSYKAVQSLQWTRSEKMQMSNYQTGDVLTFHRDGAGFSKHDMGTVVAKDWKGLTLERSDGSRSFFDPKERGHFDVGLSRALPVAAGEKLLVRSNFAPGRLKNGDLVTVDEVKNDGSLVLRDGRTIPVHFRQFTHGYATTSHAAQGKTVDHGILVLGEKGCQAANLQQAYVSNSRFRQSQTIFTSDKQAAFKAMATDVERTLAMEAVKINSWAKPDALKETVEPLKGGDIAVQSRDSLDWNAPEIKTAIRI